MNYVTWVPGQGEPTTKHDNPHSALAEAKRLFTLTGKTVYVLSATALAGEFGVDATSVISLPLPISTEGRDVLRRELDHLALKLKQNAQEIRRAEIEKNRLYQEFKDLRAKLE